MAIYRPSNTLAVTGGPIVGSKPPLITGVKPVASVPKATSQIYGLQQFNGNAPVASVPSYFGNVPRLSLPSGGVPVQGGPISPITHVTAGLFA